MAVPVPFSELIAGREFMVNSSFPKSSGNENFENPKCNKNSQIRWDLNPRLRKRWHVVRSLPHFGHQSYTFNQFNMPYLHYPHWFLKFSRQFYFIWFYFLNEDNNSNKNCLQTNPSIINLARCFYCKNIFRKKEILAIERRKACVCPWKINKYSTSRIPRRKTELTESAQINADSNDLLEGNVAQ